MNPLLVILIFLACMGCATNEHGVVLDTSFHHELTEERARRLEQIRGHDLTYDERFMIGRSNRSQSLIGD